MSFQDPAPRRERPSRRPPFAQDEDEQSAFGAPPWDNQTLVDTYIPPVADTDLGLRTSSQFFAVPDDEEEPAVRPSRGILAGAIAGFLAAAAALGAANLAAIFVRPQASPTIALGGAFIDRTPAWLKNFAAQKFGENDKTMLLLGMYVTIALLAMVIGTIAWRHVSTGVVALALVGAFGAFMAYTRPESHISDMIPSIAGGVAGIAVIICLIRAGHSIHGYKTERDDW